MKRIVVSFLTLILTTVCSAQTITIFHFNDTHSHVFPWGPKLNGEPQIGAASRWIKRYKDLRAIATNPILLHGGDSFTGDLIFNQFLGRAEFELFDSIGVDAMVLGNHDFDIKPFRLKNAIVQSRARFDFLSSNIQFSNDTSGLAQYVKRFVVKNVGPLKVGLFGLTTRSTIFYGESAPITFDTTAATAQRMVDSLKARNVDLIIAVTHLGVREDSILATQVNGIDVIVGGHSHTPLQTPVLARNPDGDTTIIVQAGARWEYLGVLTLTLSGSAKSWTYQFEPIAAPMLNDPLFHPLMESYRDSIVANYGSVYSDTVGVLLQEFPPINIVSGELELPVINLITDAYRAATRADIAVEVAPLLRQSFYAGAISTSEIRQSLAWSYDTRRGLGKRLSIVRMTGATLRFILANSSQIAGDFFGGGGAFAALTIQASGLQLTMTGIGFLPSLKDVWVNGVPLDNNRIYSVAMNEFVADLANRFPFISFISRRDTTFGPDIAVANHLRSISPFDYRAVTMGRVWDETKRTPLSFSIQNETVVISWPAKTGVVSYDLYRLPRNGSSQRVLLNSNPITGTSFTDVVPRGETFLYQLIEVRASGQRYELPPFAYQVGGLPTTTYLRAPFPNPFNASTKIVFGVESQSRVSVAVYNLLGQRIATLLDEERSQGEYEVVWSGRDASGVQTASGVYLVQMIAGSTRQEAKMLLIR